MADVHYTLAISDEALSQLRGLSKDQRRRIGQRLTNLQNNWSGDVKKLAAKEQKYRLRVGDYRVLFRLEGKLIAIYAVKDRKEAYE